MTEVNENPGEPDRSSVPASDETVTNVLYEPDPQGKSSPRPKAVAHFTPAERAARGKAARAELPRSAHGAWEPAPSAVIRSTSSRSRRRRVCPSSARSATDACSCRRSPSSAVAPT